MIGRAAAIAAVLAIAACGDDGDATAEPLPGAPHAVRALLATGDDVIVIGGDSAFGLMRLQRYADGRWTVAAGVPPFGASATLIEGDTLYAASETALYRLDDAAAFQWSDARAIPEPVPPSVIGAMADTILGAAPDDAGGALVAWEPGMRVWRDLARPLGDGARSFLVGDGHVTWSDPARGVVRAEGGVTTVIADCGECTVPVIPVAEDAVIACGTDTPPGASVRLADEPVPLGLPADLAPCVAASSGGGHGLVVTADAVLELGPSAKSWKRVTAAVTGLTYLHAGRAIYAFGDGISARGVYVLDL